MEDYFQLQYSLGRVPSQSDFDRASPEIINRWRPKFEQLQADIVDNPQAKTDLESINALLMQSLGVSTLDAPKDPTLPLAEAAAKQMYLSAYSSYIVGSTPEKARQQALKEVREEILKGRAATKGGEGSGRFLVDPKNEKGFVNVLPGGMNEQQRLAAVRQMQFARTVATGGLPGVRRNSTRLAPPAVLDQIEELRENPQSPKPAVVTYLTQELNRNGKRVSEWDVMDQLLAGGDREPLPRSRADMEAQAQLSPDLLRAINTYPSQRRTRRALTGMAWSLAKVPNNWGTLVEQAARENGLEPALLAGLLAHESGGWNPRARSNKGMPSADQAKGLAQLMDPTARELGVTNPDDPKQAIPAAARYLRRMIDTFGGDVRTGLIAYNQGPGATQRNPRGGGSQAREFPDKVLRQAAIYGWGQQAQPFNNPDLMNPRLAYRIGSLGYGSTGPHLDVKPVKKGSTETDRTQRYIEGTLDKFVRVRKGSKLVPLSQGTVTTDNDARHRARGSFGHDYAAPAGTEVYLTNGARVVSTFKGDQGTDHMIIELPDGRRFSFIHGTKA
jgi:soluble lytic murein transglycosylase-like protein